MTETLCATQTSDEWRDWCSLKLTRFKTWLPIRVTIEQLERTPVLEISGEPTGPDSIHIGPDDRFQEFPDELDICCDGERQRYRAVSGKPDADEPARAIEALQALLASIEQLVSVRISKNTVNIHSATGRFMYGTNDPARALAKLRELAKPAEPEMTLLEAIQIARATSCAQEHYGSGRNFWDDVEEAIKRDADHMARRP